MFLKKFKKVFILSILTLFIMPFSVFAYYPILIVTGSIAGLFTGTCAMLVLKRINLNPKSNSIKI